MRRRPDPRTMQRLVQVQHLRRYEAETCFSAARTEAEHAQLSASEADGHVVRCADDWQRCVASPRLVPELVALHASLLTSRVEDAGIARRTATSAADRSEACQQDLRVAEADVRVADGAMKRLRRDRARHSEEQRLSSLAERTAYLWWSR